MTERRRVRIECAGTLFGSKITDAETGAPIPRVASIVFRVDSSGEPATAEITTLMPDVVAVADADIRPVCPCCGRPAPEARPEGRLRLQRLLSDQMVLGSSDGIGGLIEALLSEAVDHHYATRAGLRRLELVRSEARFSSPGWRVTLEFEHPRPGEKDL